MAVFGQAHILAMLLFIKPDMKVRINNVVTETSAASLADLGAELQLPPRGVALAVNQRIIPRAVWANTPVQEDADITIIKAAFGG